MELQEHNALTRKARKLYGEHSAVYSVTDPARVKGYVLVAVAMKGIVESTRIGLTAAEARDNLNDVAKVSRWMAGE